MEDKDYRKLVNGIFEKIAATFDKVDPDLAEAELSQGALTISNSKTKLIVSPQPPVQQIWLAAAAQGVAVHFSLDAKTGKWMDDKGKGLEFYAYLSQVIDQSYGVKLAFG